MARSSNNSVAYIKAGNAAEPRHSLSALARHNNPAVRRRLAENPGTAASVLFRLAEDPDPEVRAALVWNPSVDTEILERLLGDEDVNVRLSLTDNHCLPKAFLIRLTGDENPYVQHHAWRALEVAELEALLVSESFAVQHGLNAKLGELIVASGKASAEAMRGFLERAQLRRIPLGHVLIREANMSKALVAKTLKLQSAVRNGQISLDQATAELRAMCGN